MSLLYKDGEFVDKEYADFTAEMYAEGHSFFTYISDSPDTLSSCCFSKNQKTLTRDENGINYLTFGELYAKGNENYEIFHKGKWAKGKLIKLPNRKMYRVTTENGKEIVVSDNHINVTSHGNKTTEKLTTDDYLLFNTQPLEVKDNKTYSEGYDFIIKNKWFDESVLGKSNDFRLGVLDSLIELFPNRDIIMSDKGKIDLIDMLIVSLGRNSEITYNDENSTYLIRICDKKYCKITNIEEYGYDDDIFCFEMQNGDEPYFTLPNGLITHNCRLSNKITENTFSFTNGLTGEATGSKSVITLNFNRIIQNFIREVYDGNQGAWKYDKEYFKIKFKEYLIPILERVYKYHTAYNEILWDLYEAKMLPVYSAGFIHLNKQYLTLGINGVNEAWMFLGGKCRYSDDYVEFCKLICGTLKEQNTAHKTKKTMFNSEFVPAESLGIKNYKWDKADGYWVPEGRNCYTSYFFLPDDEEVNVIEKFRLHGKEFVEHLDGGSACHVNLKEHLSFDQYRHLLNVAGELGTNYFTFNVKNTECEQCGYISKNTLDVCPHCGNKNLTYWTRIIGYLVKTKSFSEGRQIEEGKRVYS